MSLPDGKLHFAVNFMHRHSPVLKPHFLFRMMRKTGKLYFLTLASVAASVVAAVSICFWNDNTSQWHLWLDIVPQGFGMASLITTTLIVSIVRLNWGLILPHSARLTVSNLLGHDSQCHERRFSCGYRKSVFFDAFESDVC